MKGSTSLFMRDNSLLIDFLNTMKIGYDENKLQQLEIFYDLLIKENMKYNLTAITDYEDVLIKHYADSLALLKFIDIKPEDSILDIGTGAGFPGIPLKIFLPSNPITLIEATEKKINFIGNICDELAIDDICLCQCRAEDIAHDDEFRETYDFVLSRAVGNLSVLAEYSLAFVKVGGHFIAYKGEGAEEEADFSKNAINLMGGKLENIVHFNLSGSDNKRSFIIIKKVKSTPSKYPRSNATIKKHQL